MLYGKGGLFTFVEFESRSCSNKGKCVEEPACAVDIRHTHISKNRYNVLIGPQPRTHSRRRTLSGRNLRAVVTETVVVPVCLRHYSALFQHLQPSQQPSSMAPGPSLFTGPEVRRVTGLDWDLPAGSRQHRRSPRSVQP